MIFTSLQESHTPFELAIRGEFKLFRVKNEGIENMLLKVKKPFKSMLNIDIKKEVDF